MRTDRTAKINTGIYAAIFILMWICSTYTPKIVDDFAYHFNFLTGERITGIFQIFSSMTGHAQTMNGRLAAHFLVQIFEMLPKWIFNIVNAFMFTLQIALIKRISTLGYARDSRSWTVSVAAFGAVWVFQPAFGQVNLWLDGACNYLWAVVFGLLFLLPYIREFIDGTAIKNPIHQAAFALYGLFVGAYSENGSAAFIFMAAVLTVFTCCRGHRRPSVYGILAIAAACVGYLSMFLAPAEWDNKGAQMTLSTLRVNFIGCVEMYRQFALLLGAYVVFMVLAISLKLDRKRIILSLTLLSGSLVSNFMMMFASYYRERSAVFSCILLVAAASVLMHGLLAGQYKVFVRCLAAVLMLCTLYNLLIGLNDIYITDAQIKNNEAVIYQCKEAGITNVTLKLVTTQTKYSALNGLKYLDTYTSETWPNDSIAKYYEIDSIIGIR